MFYLGLWLNSNVTMQIHVVCIYAKEQLHLHLGQWLKMGITSKSFQPNNRTVVKQFHFIRF